MIRSYAIKLKNRVQRLNVHPVQNYLYAKHTQRNGRLDQQRSKKRAAVVVHLFYTDNWPLFSKKLHQLATFIDFDLYITKASASDTIDQLVKKEFPDAHISEYINRGRDVLPFINTAKAIGKQYDYFLKFHSKKSTHWDGGQDWLEKTLEYLIPTTKTAAESLERVLADDRTGIVGPSTYYYPITVNFPANGVHISKVLKKLYGTEKEYDVAQKNRAAYGFFAGTMFWARFDAINTLTSLSNYKDFELEAGQIDATYAHALERLFCLVPEVDGKHIYEFDGKRVVAREYKSDNIPEWSTDHNK